MLGRLEETTLRQLSANELLTRIMRSLQDGGASVEIMSATPPFELRLTSESRMQVVRFYIWNVTPGGRDLEGEQRIQVTRTPLERPPGGDAVLLGWHEEAGVFVAFDLDTHADPGKSASVQVQMKTLRRATASGMALQRKGPTEVAAAFRPENLLTYLRSRRVIQQVALIPEPAPELGVASDPTGESPDLEPSERERVTTLVSRLLRDASFQTRVLTAYEYACCACGMQLGLIEAAHIIPVAEPGSTHETANGLALCVLHHRAYDAGLISIRGDGSIRVREASIESLRLHGRGLGEDALREGLASHIRLPTLEQDHPAPRNLALGCKLRGD